MASISLVKRPLFPSVCSEEIQFSAEVVPALFLSVDANLRGQQGGTGVGQVVCMQREGGPRHDPEVVGSRGALCRGRAVLAPESLSSKGQAQSSHRTGHPASDAPASP